MRVTKEVAEKMGMIPSECPRTQLRNILLFSVYQRNQRAVDSCENHSEVLELGIIPRGLQKPENFQFRSHSIF